MVDASQIPEWVRRTDPETRMAVMAISQLYGFDLDETSDYLTFARTDPVLHMVRIVEGVLTKVTKAYDSRLSSLLEGIADYAAWISTARQHPQMRTVLDNIPSIDDLAGALNAVGYTGEVSQAMLVRQPDRMWEFLSTNVFSITSHLHDLKGAHDLPHLAHLHDRLSYMHTTAPLKVCEAYASDLLKTMQEASRDEHPSDLGTPTPRDTAMNVIFSPRMVSDRLAETHDAAEAYSRLADDSQLRLFRAALPDAYSQWGNVPRTIEQIKALDEDSVNLRKAAQLVAKSEHPKATLDMFVERSEAVTLGAKLLTVGVQAAEYTAFLATYADRRVTGPYGDSTLLNHLIFARNKEIAKTLMEHAATLVDDPKQEAIMAMSRQYQHAAGVLRTYFTALENGRPSHAHLMLRIGLTEPDAATLGEARKRLADMPDERCRQLVGMPVDISLTTLLEDPIGHRHEPQGRYADGGGGGTSSILPWIEELYSSLPARLADPFREIMPTVQGYLQTRVRTVWTQRPENIQALVEDIISYSAASWYQRLLESPQLSGRYLASLHDPPQYRHQFEVFSQEPPSNPLASLQALFPAVLQTDTTIPQPAEGSDGGLNAHDAGMTYSRFIIFGGWYQDDAQARIREAANGTPVVFVTRRDKGRHPELSLGDCVFIITTQIDHTTFSVVSRYCREYGIKCTSLDHQGINFVQDALHEQSNP